MHDKCSPLYLVDATADVHQFIYGRALTMAEHFLDRWFRLTSYPLALLLLNEHSRSECYINRKKAIKISPNAFLTLMSAGRKSNSFFASSKTSVMRDMEGESPPYSLDDLKESF
jgi:hypothetical protein